MLSGLSIPSRKSYFHEITSILLNHTIIFDKRLITESHSFLSFLTKKDIDNREHLQYVEGQFGYNVETKATLLKENCTMNNNEYLVSNYLDIDTLTRKILECLNDILCNGIKHHLNYDYFVVNRAFLDKKYKRLLSSRFYEKDGSYVTGFKMLELLGFGTCLTNCVIGSVSYGFRPHKSLQGTLYFLIRENSKKFSKIKTENVEVKRTIREKQDDYAIEGYYPNLNLYFDKIKQFSPKFEDKPILDFLNKNISHYKSLNKILYYFSQNGDFRLLSENKKDCVWNCVYSLYTDTHKLTNVKKPHRNKKTTEVIEYSPVFTIASTGRLFECNGIQGISRLSKSLIFNKKGYYNYDFSNSQLNLLSYYLNDMQEVLGNELSYESLKLLETDGITKYLSNKNNKQECANRLGISVDSWKEIMFGYLFGSNSEYKNNSMVMILKSYYHNDSVLLAEKTLELNKILGEYFSPIKVWRDNVKAYVKKKFEISKSELPSDFIETWDKLPDTGYYNGLVYVSNSFLNYNKSSWLSAFILQGKESEIIYDIVKELPHKIISYEFDGLISSKKLEQEVIDRVLNKHGIPNLKLIQKPFQSSLLEEILENQI